MSVTIQNCDGAIVKDCDGKIVKDCDGKIVKDCGAPVKVVFSGITLCTCVTDYIGGGTFGNIVVTPNPNSTFIVPRASTTTIITVEYDHFPSGDCSGTPDYHGTEPVALQLYCDPNGLYAEVTDPASHKFPIFAASAQSWVGATNGYNYGCFLPAAYLGDGGSVTFSDP